MFGSTNTFGVGHSSSSPFGSQSVFGRTSNASGNPFGTSAPFGAQTGGSMFGGTSTGVFGAPQSSSPFSSTTTTAFGASLSSSFGSSAPAFGSSSTPAFGGSSVFGQKPAFGFSTPQSSPFGSTTPQSQPAFGSSRFGPSTPFGSSSTPAFGATSTPAFGGTAFNSGSAFGAPSTPAFGALGTPAFGSSSTPSFSFGSAPAFGQSASAFLSSPFISTSSSFGAQSSPFGAQASTPAFGGSHFGQSAFGGQQGGSRVAPYAPTSEAETGSGIQPAGKLACICAMPVYRDKSHEELRCEDYQRGDKGGPLPACQPPGGTGFGATTSQANPFAPSPTFGQTSANPFPSSTSANPFGSSGFGMTTSTFGSSPFAATSSSNLFGSSSAFGASTSSPLIGSSSAPGFGSSSSIFGSAPAQWTTPAFGSSLNFASSQMPSLFSSTLSGGQTGSALGTLGRSSTPAFGQTSIFSTPSTGFGSLFSSSSSLATSTSSPFGITPSAVTPFQPAPPAQTSGGFPFGNFGQTQPANAAGVGGGSGGFGQVSFGQTSSLQSSVVMQPVPVTNPFGTLPAMPQILIAQGGTAPTIQYGISNLPVVDKPAPARISPLLTSRRLLQRRVGFPPARKCRPGGDNGPKVPFFSDDEENSNAPKADALFIPRENPRALVIQPVQKRSSGEKLAPPNHGPDPLHENGKSSEGVTDSGNHESNAAEKNGAYKTRSGHRYEHGADIEAMMPKLRRADYYTEPRIQELAAKERAEPGYCKCVKGFVVGRHGYGSIKFYGETDVRRLDLDSLVQFNNREVIVYEDESKKPGAGQGLNKPAEVTLLNVKCTDKKTGGGRKVEMLRRKAEEQGAVFVSYDPLQGVWKFIVDHFSCYKLVDEYEDHLLGC